MEKIVLGGGCFWCLDAAYKMINGVNKVVSGYAGGETVTPSYEEVASQETGHAEVVEISFDSKIINLSQLLDIFFAIHDPTTKNRQGNDVGPVYRSIILFGHDQDKAVRSAIARAQKLWDKPIVTEVVPLEHFYPAEDYHQNFYAKNSQAGYCQVIINPKLAKLREKYQNLLK